MRARQTAMLIGAFLQMVPCAAVADSEIHPLAETAVASAEVCAQCHAAIYAEWKASWMARSFTHERFQRDYLQMKEFDRQTSSQEAARCLTCHAPAAAILEDPEAANPTSREGVTCDVCHRITSVRPGNKRFTPNFSASGPRLGARALESPHHAVRASAPFADSSLCAVCHHDQIARGIHLERTFEEWFRSGYRERGIGCTDCHMPTTPGAPTTAPAFQSNRDTHRSHRFHGGHSDSPLLQGAAQVVEIRRAGERSLAFKIRNVRAGHSIPTAGAHPNQLILLVEFQDASGAILSRAERVFRFDYLDAEGNIADPGEPVRSVRDQTLGSESEKVVRLTIPSISETTGTRATEVVARLVYRLLAADELKALGDSQESKAFLPTTIHERRLSLDEDAL